MIAFILFFNAIGYSETMAQNRRTEILWDHYGVPHIYAKNTKEMYYAFGWSQMHNHANLMLKLYAQARGRAAEYFGEDYLSSDKLIQLFNIPEQAINVYKKQEDEYKTYLDAFVAGINNYARTHPEVIDERSRQVLPVTSFDLISHMIRIVSLEFVAKEDIYISAKSTGAGSNAYAIAPSKSESKNAMLVSNSHLPWSDYSLYFEAHLNTVGFNSYGIALVGMPAIIMAFNDHLGWTFTVNPIDCSDRYELTLQDGGYLLDGKTLRFEKKKATIKVKQKDGRIEEEELEFNYSKHGPVVAQSSHKAFAVRIAGLDNFSVFEQYHKMNKAKNLTEFESALKMQQMAMFNIIYADKSGNILYLFNGNVPIREEGDFAFWKGTIDGTQSKFIWTKTHPYNDLPRCLNPPSGFIQNCNDAPWTCTEPAVLDAKNFPPYFSSLGTSFRPQRAVNMIKDNPSISFDQLISCKHDTGMETAHRFLDDLLAAADAYPDTMVLKAASVLRRWDKKTEVDSRGAVLFAKWWDSVSSDLFEVPWNAKVPNTTPDGIKDKKKAVELLGKAANEVKEKYGSLDVAWGDVYRFRLNGIDYPANGGSGEYGIFRTLYFTDDGDKKIAVAGETYVAIVEFGKKVKAMVLLGYGNATQAGSKHIGDQLQMLSEKKLRPALINKANIINNLEFFETLSMETDKKSTL